LQVDAVNVHLMILVASRGVNNPQFDLTTRQIVGIVKQVKLVGLGAANAGEILSGDGNVIPLTTIGYVVPLLKLDIVTLVALIPCRQVQVDVSRRDCLVLAKNKVIREAGSAVDLA